LAWTTCGTHFMCRTKASLIYRRTKNLCAVQLLLDRSKLESTVRYLGIEVRTRWTSPSRPTPEGRGHPDVLHEDGRTCPCIFGDCVDSITLRADPMGAN
jgi:hypothetical protein